jgi:DNA-binding response OmpR family regulator
VYINYLRNKLDRAFEPKLLHTVRGVGYMLKTPTTASHRVNAATKDE